MPTLTKKPFTSTAPAKCILSLWAQTRRAAHRFAVTRVTDVYLAGGRDPDKDFRRYVARLEAWRAMGPDGLGWR